MQRRAEGANRAQKLMRVKALPDACVHLVRGMPRFEVAIAQPGLDFPYDLAHKRLIGAARLERQCTDHEQQDQN